MLFSFSAAALATANAAIRSSSLIFATICTPASNSLDTAVKKVVILLIASRQIKFVSADCMLVETNSAEKSFSAGNLSIGPNAEHRSTVSTFFRETELSGAEDTDLYVMLTLYVPVT